MDDERWTAVTDRDESADGAFVFAVKTTGIYCRPGCPARTPKRENVRFFATPEDARAAGFRSCKRCRPDEASPADIRSDRNLRATAAACRRIEAAAADDGSNMPSSDQLAEDSGLSPGQFHRVFRRTVGLTPHEYAAAVRSGRFLAALERGSAVTDAVYEAGYSGPSRAYDEFRGQSGLTPSRHRRGAPGIDIRFAVAPCRLGWALVAVSPKGLCAAFFGDVPEEMPGVLARRFPRARLTEASPADSRLIRESLMVLDGDESRLDLPLDIQGTAFQKKVWKALRNIPAGETATYGEIARSIGAPDASRAVANACGANRIAVHIPCHRVVRADGSPGGYRWGSERKRRLLEEESAEKAAKVHP